MCAQTHVRPAFIYTHVLRTDSNANTQTHTCTPTRTHTHTQARESQSDDGLDRVSQAFDVPQGTLDGIQMDRSHAASQTSSPTPSIGEEKICTRQSLFT